MREVMLWLLASTALTAPLPLGAQRELFERRGIRLIVSFDGELSQFSAENLLLQIIGGLVLLSLASLVSHFIITKCLGMKEIYKSHLYEFSEDMSCYREVSPAQLKLMCKFAARANKQGRGIFSEYTRNKDKYGVLDDLGDRDDVELLELDAN